MRLFLFPKIKEKVQGGRFQPPDADDALVTFEHIV